jgi:hypothetical protein
VFVVFEAPCRRASKGVAPRAPKLPSPKEYTWPLEVSASECVAPAATLAKCAPLMRFSTRGCAAFAPSSPFPAAPILDLILS